MPTDPTAPARLVLPATMRAAVAYSFDDVRVEMRPVPVPGPGEALVRVTASGICTGDVTPWYINQKAKKSGGSIVMGHEAAGVIVALGPGAPSKFKLGDRVVPHHHAPCLNLECRFCKYGNHVECPEWKPTGFDPGGVADYMVVKANCLLNDTHHVPAGISDEDAALTEPTACCVKAVYRRTNYVPGKTLLIIGLGVMGTLNLLVARSLKFSKIIGTDLIDWRLDRAKQLGCDVVINPKDKDLPTVVREATNGGADCVICGPGVVPVMQSAIQCVVPGGTVCYFMTTDADVQMPVRMNDLYFREVTLTQSYSCGPDDMRQALELIRLGYVRADKIVTHRAKLADYPAAFWAAAKPGANLKTMIKMIEP